MLLKTIIVEDEPLSRAFLNNLLSEFCPQIEVVATVPTEQEAIEAIERLQPDLLFLDIELQQGTGFEVLKKTRQHRPAYQVVFTTAFDHYGIKAIKFSGVEFLQKPIDIEGLQAAIVSIVAKRQSEAAQMAVTHLLHTLDNNNVPEQLVIQTAEGALYVSVAAINFIEAGADGCNFNTDTGVIASVGKSIKEYEQMLADHQFFRVHHSYLINIKKVITSSMAEGGSVRMPDASIIPVSPKRTEELKNLLSAINDR